MSTAAAAEAPSMAEHKFETIMTQLVESKTRESLLKVYDDWGGQYDNDISQMYGNNSFMPRFVLGVARHVSDFSCRVLDVCAGTGIGGEALRDAGFTNIDAIDGSSGMLEQAKKKQVYKNLFEEIIGDCVHSCSPESYDLLFACGAFCPNHLSGAHVQPLLEILRRGGLFAITLRKRWRDACYGQQLQEDFRRLEAEGKWSRVSHEELTYPAGDGLTSSLLIFRKL